MTSLENTDLSHLIGQKVGTSTLLKEIARGSMGAVFVGFQGSLKRQIAVKVLPKSVITPMTATGKIMRRELKKLEAQRKLGS